MIRRQRFYIVKNETKIKKDKDREILVFILVTNIALDPALHSFKMVDPDPDPYSFKMLDPAPSKMNTEPKP